MTGATAARLIEYLESITPNSDVRLDEKTRIFDKGLFDSLALVQLVAWVEGEVGRSIDPQTIDFVEEWATIGHVAAFVDAGR
jgi:acyl carrier protein